MKSKIDRIRYLLQEVHKRINNITEESFDKTMLEIKVMLAESQEHKAYLKAKYPLGELSRYNGELTELTKQLSGSFDNIIKKKRQDLKNVVSKMKFVQNQRKLANYHR